MSPTVPHAQSQASGAPSATRDSALALLVRHGDCTAADLAGRLGVSVQVMRRHLRSLEEDGLVEASPAAEGPGRPSNHWRLTSRGQDRFPDGSEHFALGLLESLADTLPAETIQELLARQASQKASSYRELIGSGPLEDRIQRLVELRRSEGYVAEVSAATEFPTGGWILSEFHCSVMRIAQQFPCVCEQELQLIRHTFPDCSVERVHWRLEKGHSCGFHVTPTTSSPA
jgi:DeoR family suf operon transcriptional repressor